MIVSQLQVENKASSFTVPELTITERNVLYEGPVHFTPLIAGELVDGEKIRALLEGDYAAAGITPGQVDTGAVIITGETSRKENAGSVLTALSGFAGEFVVATAGPHLESVLAAKGAGAVDYSERTGKTVLHMDIGGGTSNLSLVEGGEIRKTGCLNVGGRLIKLDKTGAVTYVSPVLKDLCRIAVGDVPSETALYRVAELLARALSMAAGFEPPTELLARLSTAEAGSPWIPVRPDVVSFSGGVADCIEKDLPILAYGDIGVLLGRAIRAGALCKGEYRLGDQTIRATVIGAGCHSARLSGSTVYHKGVSLPRKNLPVAALSMPVTADAVANAYAGQDTDTMVLAIPGYAAPTYGQVRQLAEMIAEGSAGREIFVCLESDMAKALGHALALLRPETPCLCIDRVRLGGESYLDIGQPVGPALPVVVKTLVLQSR
jgi:ethanolamine utilization protein EutA